MPVSDLEQSLRDLVTEYGRGALRDRERLNDLLRACLIEQPARVNNVLKAFDEGLIQSLEEARGQPPARVAAVVEEGIQRLWTNHTLRAEDGGREVVEALAAALGVAAGSGAARSRWEQGASLSSPDTPQAAPPRRRASSITSDTPRASGPGSSIIALALLLLALAGLGFFYLSKSRAEAASRFQIAEDNRRAATAVEEARREAQEAQEARAQIDSILEKLMQAKDERTRQELEQKLKEAQDAIADRKKSVAKARGAASSKRAGSCAPGDPLCER
jgi:hypothetical protein